MPIWMESKCMCVCVNHYTKCRLFDYILFKIIQIDLQCSGTLQLYWFIYLRDYRRCHQRPFSITALLRQEVKSHHYHHVVPLAQISLTLSRHFSLSFIASGRSSGLHPISSRSCWMYVCAGHPAFARPYVGVHRSTSLSKVNSYKWLNLEIN